MNRLSITLLIFLCLVLTVPSYAEPNWQAIDSARAEKQSVEQANTQAKTTFDDSFEKLKAACDKAKNDAEVTLACHEMIEILSSTQAELIKKQNGSN